ncbi:hypothetical protein CEUSTIGMA_g4084.t1 [Chlamydomonas eustigma]|uniref:Uncharacterized protein n=1 Tax=Chlamydomonas eustigma TaxID=1157962 RepID=A0A250X0N5_9CHLO|nr:hypothetical protein CEUSTIGMA_g4084.t1 [Chlamydomonas eustigma]|eukprot:GAX76638.1 hypothetical protein CEUSTIGMA_g4084.t1 [Chlamydomonas eustigma]
MLIYPKRPGLCSQALPCVLVSETYTSRLSLKVFCQARSDSDRSSKSVWNATWKIGTRWQWHVTRDNRGCAQRPVRGQGSYDENDSKPSSSGQVLNTGTSQPQGQGGVLSLGDGSRKQPANNKGFGPNGKQGKKGTMAMDPFQRPGQLVNKRQSLAQAQDEVATLSSTVLKLQAEAEEATKALEQMNSMYKEKEKVSIKYQATFLNSMYKEKVVRLDTLNSEANMLRQQLHALATPQTSETLQPLIATDGSTTRHTDGEASNHASDSSEVTQAADPSSSTSYAEQAELMSALELKLTDASMRASEVLELRSDLHILAEAFQEKERESAIYEASLKATRTEVEDLQQKIKIIAEKLETAERDRASAEESVERLQESLKLSAEEKAELVRSKQELLNAIRARDRVSRAVESKTAELEASLVGFSAQIMDLREQLSVKEHVLIEEGQKLKVSQREALDLNLEVQKLQNSNKEKSATIDLLQKEQEAAASKVDVLSRELRSACDLLERRDSEVTSARSQLDTERKEKAKLEEQLQSAQEQFKAAQGDLRASKAHFAAEQLEAEKRAAELKNVIEDLRKLILEKEKDINFSQQKVTLLSAEKAELKQKYQELSLTSGDASHQAQMAEAALASLREELAVECAKTQLLLDQAEQLVLQNSASANASAGVESEREGDLDASEQTAVTDGQTSLVQVKSTEDLGVGDENKTSTAEIQIASLKYRILQLTSLLKTMKSSESKAADVSHLNGSTLKADGVSELKKKVEELQQENIQLKQLSIKQQQIISQTRSFLGELKERASVVPR